MKIAIGLTVVALGAVPACASIRPVEPARRVIVRLEPEAQEVLELRQTNTFKTARCAASLPTYYECTEAVWRETKAALCAKACASVVQPGERVSCAKLEIPNGPNMWDALGRYVLVCLLAGSDSR